MTNYNRKRYYTSNGNAESNSRLVHEVLELRQTVKDLEFERERLRGSLLLFEAELAQLQEWHDIAVFLAIDHCNTYGGTPDEHISTAKNYVAQKPIEHFLEWLPNE